MSRNVPEWIGKTDETKIPDRVRLRVFLHYGGVCQCGCGRHIRSGDRWDLDHAVALINGGGHREKNLVPLLLECHRSKTARDVAEKAKTYAKRKAHYGLKKPKGRPIPGSRRSPWKRKMDGTLVRR